MKRAFAAATLLVLSCATSLAHADAETDALFREGVASLDAGRPAQAIANFEALADRGVTDATASYDRGLAYAMRVRVGGEVPGDLGRAAHGFEEARALTSDPSLAKDAAAALGVIRTEVARRRARAGEPVEIDPGVPALRVAARLLEEETWFWIAAVASLLIAAGFGARAWSGARRVRIAGVVVAGASSLVLAASAGLAWKARSDRLHLHEAVVVAPAARPCDAHGIAITGATPLPEAARVELLDDERGSFSRVRFGATETWVPSSTLREIER